MINLIDIETIKFSRPNSNTEELGCRVTNGEGKSIIIDMDFNIVLNASYKAYKNDSVRLLIQDF